MFNVGDVVNVIIPENVSDFFGIQRFEWQYAMEHGPYEIIETNYGHGGWEGYRLNVGMYINYSWPEYSLLLAQASQEPDVEDLL